MLAPVLGGIRRSLDHLLGRRTAHPPPTPPEPEAAARLRARLAAWLAHAPERYHRLFLAGRPLFTRGDERELAEALRTVGLVERLAPSVIQPCVRLFPLYERFVATDLLTHRGPDQVFSLMFEQVYLVRNMGARPGDRVLEPCLGSGVGALFAADQAAAVTGVDLSERALAFAAFNEALGPGGVPLERLHGSLLEPLADDRLFDLVIVNPPFELVPEGEPWFLHSDGGEDGLDVVRALLPQVPRHLAEGGRFEIVTWSPATAGGPLLVDLMREHLDGMRLLVHVLAERPLDDHLARWRQARGYEAFRARLADRGLETVQFLFVHAAPAATPGVEVVHPEAEIATCHEIADPWRDATA